MKKLLLIGVFGLLCLLSIASVHADPITYVTYVDGEASGYGTGIDLNGNEFFSGTYAGVLWEYDFSLLDTNEYYQSIMDYSITQLLPRVGTNTSNTQVFYKSLFIKYDPGLYLELMTVFSAYLVLAQNAAEENGALASALNNIGELTMGTYLANAFRYFYKGNSGSYPSGEEISVAMNYYLLKVNENSCEDLTSPLGAEIAETCKLLNKKGAATIASFDMEESTLQDVISEQTLSLGKTIVIYEIFSALKKLGVGAYNLVRIFTNVIGMQALLLGEYRAENAIQYYGIVANIENMLHAFMTTSVTNGRNLRIDYLLPEILGVDYSIGLYEYSAEDMYSALVNRTVGIQVSFSDTDIVFEEVVDDLSVRYTVPGYDYSQGTIPVKGTMTKLTKAQVEAEISAIGDIYDDAPLDCTNAFEFAVGFDHYLIDDAIGFVDFPIGISVDRNRYYDADTFYFMPHPICNIVVTSSSAARVYYSFSSQIQYISSTMILKKSNIQKDSDVLLGTGGIVSYTNLVASSNYVIEVWILLDSPYDAGTILVKAFVGGFSTPAAPAPITTHLF